MSEEEGKINSIEKSVKIKDPKRVELGKRLAKISKEAKARKAKERKEKEKLIAYLDTKHFIGVASLAATLIGLYFTFKQYKRREEEKNQVVSVKKEEKENQVANVKKDKTKRCLENL